MSFRWNVALSSELSVALTFRLLQRNWDRVTTSLFLLDRRTVIPENSLKNFINYLFVNCLKLLSQSLLNRNLTACRKNLLR
jgi:hypothetical protein